VCIASSCQLECADGGIDTDGDLSNGCECTPTNAGVEICDGEDNDCDGVADNGCDEDGDGFCNTELDHTAGAACEPGDCDDTNPDINPEGTPGCDGVDNDCDGDVDNLAAVPSRRVTTTLRGSYSATSNEPSPILAAFADDGFCFAALDDARADLTLGFVGASGQTSEVATDVDTTVNVDILDLGWDGSDCAVLFREGAQSLNLRRWRPGDSSTVTLETSPFLSTQGDWASLRNAALWFGPVSRCDGGRCTTAPRWVVASMFARGSVADGLVYQTVPQGFTDDETLLPGLSIDPGTSTNADVDLAGTGIRGDGFLVLQRTIDGTMTVHEVIEEEVVVRDDLEITDPEVSRELLDASDGALYLQLRREQSSGRWETGLNQVGVRGYQPQEAVSSDADARFIGREFVYADGGGSQLFIDPYADAVYRATPAGTGDRFFDFQELTHPEFDRFTELLAPGRAAGYLWVASLIDESSYEVAVDAFACY
jgi:hypothetical protein